MKTLQYVGPSHYRELSTADVRKVAERTGIDGEALVGFKLAGRNAKIVLGDFDTPEYVDLPDEVADWLLEWEPADWRDVTKKAAAMAAEGQLDDAESGESSDARSGARGSAKKKARES